MLVVHAFSWQSVDVGRQFSFCQTRQSSPVARLHIAQNLPLDKFVTRWIAWEHYSGQLPHARGLHFTVSAAPPRYHELKD